MLRKARDLQKELERDGPDIVRILQAAAAIAGILGGGTTFALNAPDIISAVQRLHITIGDEVLEQEDRTLALPGPQKLLSAPEAAGDSPP